MHSLQKRKRKQLVVFISKKELLLWMIRDNYVTNAMSSLRVNQKRRLDQLQMIKLNLMNKQIKESAHIIAIMTTLKKKKKRYQWVVKIRQKQLVRQTKRDN